MSDLTPKGFSNGQYVDRYLLRDKLYAEDAVTMGGVAILNNFPAADVVKVVRCRDCKYRAEDDFCTCRWWPDQLVDDDGFCEKGKRQDGGQHE